VSVEIGLVESRSDEFEEFGEDSSARVQADGVQVQVREQSSGEVVEQGAPTRPR